MRNTIIIILLALLYTGCSKDIKKKEFNGEISGNIKLLDTSGNELKDYANVLILAKGKLISGEIETTDSNKVDGNGNYIIKNIFSNNNNIMLEARYKGYPIVAKNITIDKSKSITQDFELKPAVYNNYSNLSISLSDPNGYPVNKGSIYLFYNPTYCDTSMINKANFSYLYQGNTLEIKNVENSRNLFILSVSEDKKVFAKDTLDFDLDRSKNIKNINISLK